MRTWGFNGGYLGPTLRATRDERVLVHVRNRLGEDTTVHWHGMHLPADMDGGPHQVVPAGGNWSPDWRIDQPAATLWYHPHLHRETARHVYRGLAGLFIIDDPATSAPALPHRYGVDDIPVIVQDKKFAGDALDETANRLGGVGLLGDTIAPYFPVTTERVRLRLLNGSNARGYDFGFADGRRFALVGTDGGLRETPYRTTRVMLSPGERAEIVVTMRPGERAVLQSFPPPQLRRWIHPRHREHLELHIMHMKSCAGCRRRCGPSIPPWWPVRRPRFPVAITTTETDRSEFRQRSSAVQVMTLRI